MSELLDQLTTCQRHDRRWLFMCPELCHQQICGKCCLNLLSFDVYHKDILSFLNSSVQNCNQLATIINNCQNNEEVFLFVMTITGLLFNSDPEIQSSAKNCLKCLMNQINDKSVLNSIFEEIISEINKLELSSIESIVELMADFHKEIDVFINDWILVTDGNDFDPKNEFNQLIRRFQDSFDRLSPQISDNVLRIMGSIYKTTADPSFELDLDFHLKTLRMLFVIFDKFNSYSEDSKNIAINLLQWLSKIDSILNLFINDKNFNKYLKTILNESSLNNRKLAIDWICDQLIKDSTRGLLTTIVENEFMDSFISSLVSAIDNSILRKLLECLTLIICNQMPQKPISGIRLENMTRNVIRCLETAVHTKDDIMFKLCLASILQLIRKSKRSNFITEFDFIGIINIIEFRISSPDLYKLIVDFLTEYCDLNVMPIIIPTKKLAEILELIVNNMETVNVFDEDMCRQLTIRSISVVSLIKSIVNLINSTKDRDFDPNLNISPFFELNATYYESQHMDTTDTNSLIEDSIQTDLYSLLERCLKNIELFFIKCMKDLISDKNIEENSELFHQISGSLKVLIENKLFVSQDIYLFVKRMFTSGHILNLNKLFWICEPPLKSERFATDVSIVISLFVCEIQEFEYQNKYYLDFGDLLDRDVNQKSIYEQIGFNYDLIIGIEENQQIIDNFFSTFFAIHYYSLKNNSKNHTIDGYHLNTFSKILMRYLTKYLKRPNDNIQTIITVKHSLFLSAFVELDEQCFTALSELFDGTNEEIEQLFSKCYTNDIILLKWLFTHYDSLFRVESNSFCKYAIKELFDSEPDFECEPNRKQMICSFFQIINSSERGLQVFIDFLFYAIEDELIIEAIQFSLEDTDEFLDECHIHQNWMDFRQKIFQKIPAIVNQLTQEIKDIFEFGSDFNPYKERKVVKMLSFVIRLLSNGQNQYDFKEFGEEFKKLLPDLRQLMDKPLEESSIEAIFKFFRTCMASDEDFGSIQKSFTDYLLIEDSKTLFLIYNCVNNCPATDDNLETALYLLSMISQNKSKYQMKTRFQFQLDINRLIHILNSESKVEVENAFILLTDSFDTDFYFKNNKKSTENKIHEMRQLLSVLQTAVFRQLLTFTEISKFLDKLFNGLKSISMPLLKDLANSKFFPMLITSHIKDNGLESEPLVDILLVFCRLDFIIESLIPIMNEVIDCLIKKFNESQDNGIDDNIYELFQTVHLGQYCQHLSRQNYDNLKPLSKRGPKSKPLTKSGEHNYSRQ